MGKKLLKRWADLKPPSEYGWPLAIGFGVAFSLLTAPFSRPLLPEFNGILLSSRDVMAVWFSILGTIAMGALAWRLSPGISWLVWAYLLSSLSVGYQGFSMENTQTLLWAVALLLLLTSVWDQHKPIILWGMTVAMSIHLAVSLSQMFIVEYPGWWARPGLVWRDPFFMTAREVREVEALASHYSLYGALLATATPLIALRLGWPAWVIAPAVVMGLQHRSSMMAMALAAFISFPGKHRWKITAAALVLVGAVVLMRGSFKDHYGWSMRAWTGDRLFTWTVTAAKAFQKPWVGWGPGTFYIWKPTFILTKGGSGLTFLQAHNDYLQLFFEAGLIGLAAVPMIATTLVRRLRRARPWSPELRAAVAGMAAMAFLATFSFTSRIGATGMMSIIMLAAVFGELKMAEAKRATGVG